MTSDGFPRAIILSWIFGKVISLTSWPLPFLESVPSRISRGPLPLPLVFHFQIGDCRGAPGVPREGQELSETQDEGQTVIFLNITGWHPVGAECLSTFDLYIGTI